MGVRNPQKGQPRHGGVMSSGDLLLEMRCYHGIA